MKIINILLERKKFISFSLLRIISMFLGLLSNIIIIRNLSVENFGIFSVALLVVNLITTFGFSWSSSSILYFGGKEREKYGNINKTFWARNLIIFFTLVIITIGIVLFRDFLNNYIGINIWYLLILWLYVSVIEDYLNNYFLAVKRQLTSSMLSITAKVIYIVLIIVIPFDVTTLILLYIVSHASVIFYSLGINKSDIGKYEFDKNWFKEILNFSLWQLFGYSGVYLINFGDTAVIKYFMTNEDIGIYNAAYQLFNAIASFAFVISSFYASNISSYFAKGDKRKIKQFFYRERFYIIIASTITHIVVILFSETIIVTLYGEKFIESVRIFNILMIGSMFRYASVFYMLYYNTNNKYRLQQILNIFQAVINVILNIILIQIIGLIGAAIATVISIILKIIFSFFYCEKRIMKLSN